MRPFAASRHQRGGQGIIDDTVKYDRTVIAYRLRHVTPRRILAGETFKKIRTTTTGSARAFTSGSSCGPRIQFAEFQRMARSRPPPSWGDLQLASASTHGHRFTGTSRRVLGLQEVKSLVRSPCQEQGQDAGQEAPPPGLRRAEFLPPRAAEEGLHYDTVRCAFVEGGPPSRERHRSRPHPDRGPESSLLVGVLGPQMESDDPKRPKSSAPWKR